MKRLQWTFYCVPKLPYVQWTSQKMWRIIIGLNCGHYRILRKKSRGSCFRALFVSEVRILRCQNAKTRMPHSHVEDWMKNSLRIFVPFSYFEPIIWLECTHVAKDVKLQTFLFNLKQFMVFRPRISQWFWTEKSIEQISCYYFKTDSKSNLWNSWEVIALDLSVKNIRQNICKI